MSKELRTLEQIKKFLGYSNWTMNLSNEFNLIEQALIKAQEQESENNALLEENNDLYAELTFANKQYKELIESTKQYQKVLETLKSKAMFYDNNTKCKIEIEADDFNSSKEWEQVKEVLGNE